VTLGQVGPGRCPHPPCRAVPALAAAPSLDAVLEEMRIRGLGVITDAVLELHPGLTVVTGETGAGKTMVVQSLGLLAGGRADTAMVGPGVLRALVEGRLAAVGDEALRRVASAGGELDDDGGLIVSRLLSTEGRSRASLGGAAVPVGVLADLVGDLVTVHGQHGAQRMLRPGEQRAALDRHGGRAVAAAMRSYAGTWRSWRAASEELAELTDRARDRAQEAELLRAGLERVATVEPVDGEDDALAVEAERLRNSGDLRVAAEHAHAALAGDPAAGGEDAADVLTLVAAARRALGAAADHDPELADLAVRVAELGHLAADVAAELSSYSSGVDADPARLEAVEGRRASLTALTRAYGPDLAGVLRWAAAAGLRLCELDGDDDRREELTAERDRLHAELVSAAGELSRERRSAAARLGDAVTGELRALAMPHASITCTVTATAPGPHGADDVELLLVPHPGAPARALSRGASGGERSRVMLAVEVVLAGDEPAGTLVFDEVDAGVGGRAAVEVGRRLARLSRDHQVVCVTHLPQVAAFADRHLRVVKSDDGTVTESGVETLDDTGRVRELSRMLAGLDDSDFARGHAEELLAAACAAKLH